MASIHEQQTPAGEEQFKELVDHEGWDDDSAKIVYGDDNEGWDDGQSEE